jgi:putative hemolysin
VRSPLTFSLRIAGPLLRVKSLLALPTTLLQRLNRGVLGVLERVLPGDDLAIQGDEMVALMSLGEEHGSIGARERQLVEGVFELGDRSVQEVMTQRVDLLLIESGQLAGEAALALRKAGRSYAPVFEDSPDSIVGLISAPLLLAADPLSPVGGICVETEFCPESRSAGSLLRELLERDLPLAVVLDEYGALAGMATLEDLYEVLVGEILDSEDRERLRFYQPVEGTLVASSRLPLDKAVELLGLPFASDEMETLGGYFMERLGEVPRLGDSHELDGLRWTVLSSVGPALGTLRIERLS